MQSSQASFASTYDPTRSLQDYRVALNVSPSHTQHLVGTMTWTVQATRPLLLLSGRLLLMAAIAHH